MGLIVWAIYENPSDHPGKFVVRRWVGLTPDLEAKVCDTLAEARTAMPAGLFRMNRFPHDDPVVVEAWI